MAPFTILVVETLIQMGFVRSRYTGNFIREEDLTDGTHISTTVFYDDDTCDFGIEVLRDYEHVAREDNYPSNNELLAAIKNL